MLYVTFSKCKFWIREVHFLGNMVISKGIHFNPFKVEEIKNWEALKSPTEVRQFIGLARYYRRFIENFSRIANPLTTLTQKEIKFVWRESQQVSFQRLKEILCSKPILSLPEGTNEFITLRIKG